MKGMVREKITVPDESSATFAVRHYTPCDTTQGGRVAGVALPCWVCTRTATAAALLPWPADTNNQAAA